MIFEVTAEQIELLNDADLRELIGRLCEEEVRRQGHSPAAVTWGGHQNARDGGIDVRVSLPQDALLSGYVPAAATGFQVKAQDMPRQAIIDEMAPEGTLRRSIADLVAERGAYIIASSKGSVADSALQERKRAMRDAASTGGVSLAVDFYDRGRIASWVNQHLGLIPWVRERVSRPLAGWRPFTDWSSSPAPLDKPYLLDSDVRLHCPSNKSAQGFNAADGIETLRQILGSPRGIVRLVGLSGVGKTRLVQALFDGRIGKQPLPAAEAIYADIADAPDPVPLELASFVINLNRRAILIIDNCGPDLHQRLAARITSADCQLSLITVEYDITDDEHENTSVFRLEAASVSLIEKMLEEKFSHVPGPSRSFIAKISDGNARIAIALAQTAKAGESLANLHDSQLFSRLFQQSKTPSEELLTAAKVCALLYSFDGETVDGAESELRALADLAGISVDQLYKHVADLARRKLVQKRSKWRAILPHALAHRLATLALEDIPFPRIEERIINGGSERILRSFSKRVGYLHDSEHAAALAATWFSEDGLLKSLGRLTDLGTALFANIAPIDPALTLAYIERTATREAWFFGPENGNREEIVRVLRLIAFDAALFDRATALLSRFVLRESCGEDDKAADVLRSFFHLYLSGTHATPAQRTAVVRKFLDSDIHIETQFGLKLLSSMLSSGPFSSHHGFEFGARPRDYGFHPRRGPEIAEWFREAVKVASDAGMTQKPIATEVRKLVAVRFADLCWRGGMIVELAALTERYTQRFSWPQGWIGIRAAIRKCKGKVDDASVAKLEELAARLRPDGIADMIRTYALSREWGPLDMANLEEKDGETRADARQRIYELCAELGAQLTQDQSQLENLLPEILGSDSYKTSSVGQGLATGCSSLAKCWSTIQESFLALDSHPRSSRLLSGFMSAASKRSQDEAEVILDAILADPRMHSHFVSLQADAGLGGRAFERLVAALQLTDVPLASYETLAYGRSHLDLSDDQIRSLSKMILQRDGGAPIVAEILGMRMFGSLSDKVPVSETMKAAGRELLEQFRFEEKKAQGDHLLGVIVGASLDRLEHEGLARRVSERIVEAARSFRVSAWDMGDTISGLTKAFPRTALDVFVERDENDPYRSARMIFHDMREHNRACPLQSIPEETWVSWAKEKPQTRYVRLAEVVRFSDANDDDKSLAWSPTAERIIGDAPSPAAVLDVFLDRFTPMSWSGSRADILASRISLMEALMGHGRPEVVDWAIAHISEFIRLVDETRAQEAREDRSRDERFE